LDTLFKITLSRLKQIDTFIVDRFINMGKYTRFVFIAIIVTFGFQFGDKALIMSKADKPCMVAYDGFGYYSYLPYFAENGNLHITKEWSEKVMAKYCDNTLVYQFHPTKSGNDINIYHMGLAFVQIPVYVGGTMLAWAMDKPADGFSTPYFIAFLLYCFGFVVLGARLLIGVLRNFFNDVTTAITLFVIYFCSNLFITFTLQYDLPHLYLFALHTLFFSLMIRFKASMKTKTLIFAAVVLGLCSFIRPTSALLGILPLFILYKEHKFSKEFFKKIMLFPLFGLLWNLPQILYWYLVGGELLMTNLHTEEIILIDPNLFDFLLSFKKGWFIYSPIMLLLFLGGYSLYKKKNEWLLPLGVMLPTFIWVLSSWECWWYASSYGSRVMIELYPFIAIFLGAAIQFLTVTTLRKISLLVSIIFCFVLTELQSKQYHNQQLHMSRMTGAHYQYIFADFSGENQEKQRLEIDRDKLDWPEEYALFSKSKYQLDTVEVYSLKYPLILNQEEGVELEKYVVLDHLESDEAMFNVELTSKTSTPNKSVRLRMEFGSRFNNYGWHSIEFSKDQPLGLKTQGLKINAPNIRHRNDFLKIFVDNTSGSISQIQSIRIYAVVLRRVNED
jgi:hypothetical protein